MLNKNDIQDAQNEIEDFLSGGYDLIPPKPTFGFVNTCIDFGEMKLQKPKRDKIRKVRATEIEIKPNSKKNKSLF